jgi:hypothetical protein
VVSTDGDYCTVGWKVELVNNSADEMTGLSVKFSFRDKDDVEVCEGIQNDVDLKPHETQTVTSTRFMKCSEWDEIEKYNVSTEAQ